MFTEYQENNIYQKLKIAFSNLVKANHLLYKNVEIHCRALLPKEAIGNPEHEDYPIIKGREVMIEADFCGSRGQSFADSFEQRTYKLKDIISMDLNTNKKRASFISALNAVFCYSRLSEKTIHCRDSEPVECMNRLLTEVDFLEKILLIGFQPRFVDVLANNRQLRIIDLDENNIGKEFYGVIIEPEENTSEALEWCDMVFATGSTIVNGTIMRFLDQSKPVVFYGVTISASGKILGLNTYCPCGH